MAIKLARANCRASTGIEKYCQVRDFPPGMSISGEFPVCAVLSGS